MHRFEGKVVVVTGAASGIGLATAKRLASEGARVVVADIDDPGGSEAEKQVRAAGAPDARCVHCDVSKEDQVVACVEVAVAQLGGIDGIVNNAGLMSFKPIEEQDTDDWRRILDVDLLGAFYFIKQAFLRMKSGGAIVNISSIHAVETEPLVAPYAAAKTALLSLTRSAALEGKPKGIRVNAILPGAIDTPMLWENPNVKAGIEKIDPNDVGKPENVAALAAYLLSNDSQFVQGASVRLDGGRLGRL